MLTVFILVLDCTVMFVGQHVASNCVGVYFSDTVTYFSLPLKSYLDCKIGRQNRSKIKCGGKDNESGERRTK